MANVQLFRNNIQMLITEFLNAGDTQISVSDAEGLDNPTDGDYYVGTIIPNGGLGQLEIVKITAITTVNNVPVLTVVRGQENTSPQNYLFGSVLALRVTAAALNNIPQSGVIVDEVLAEIQPVLEPNFYTLGGRGDGVTNNSVPLQTMLTNATHQGWHLNSGRYSFTTPVISDYTSLTFPIAGTPSPRAAINGESEANTILNYAGTSHGITMIANFNTQGLNSLDTYSNFTYQCQTQNQANSGLYIQNRALFRFDNITFQYFNTAVQMDACYTGTFYNCHFNFNDLGLLMTSTNGEAVNLMTFNSCTFGSNTTFGISGNINACLSFYGCDISSNGNMALPTTTGGVNMNIIAPLAGPIVFDSCYFEGNMGLADLLITNNSGLAATVIVKNCTFNRGTPTIFTTNNINIQNGAGSTTKLILEGSSFCSVNSYVPSAARPFISADGATEVINLGSSFTEATSWTNAPVTHGRVTGGLVGINAVSNNLPLFLTATKTGTGVYRITHNGVGFGPTTTSYIAIATSSDSTGGIKVERISQNSNTFFTVVLTNTAGTPTDAGFAFHVLQLF